jgi:hypothetical protein
MKQKSIHCNLNQNFRKFAGITAVGAATGGGFLSFGQQAHAQTVILQDNFTSGSQYGTNIGAGSGTQNGNPYTDAGLSPSPVDATLGTYLHETGAHYDAQVFSGSKNGTTFDQAGFHNDAAAAFNLGSFNTGNLTISAMVSFNAVQTGGTTAVPGSSAELVLGFATAANTTSNYGPADTQNFTGLQAMPNGSLQEYVDGTAVGSAVPYTGTYNYLNPTSLSYTINTTTGAISNVSFGTSTTDYSFGLGTFTNSNSAYVEIGGDFNNSGNYAIFNDLMVEGVPEPSTYALLAAGAVALGAIQFRCRRNA